MDSDRPELTESFCSTFWFYNPFNITFDIVISDLPTFVFTILQQIDSSDGSFLMGIMEK